MPRLTRQESQQATRLKLIKAAEKEILRAGIYEASIRRICDAAGYTLGAFYSNFKNKDELLLEVVERQISRAFASLNDMLRETAMQEEKKVLEKLSVWLRALQKNKILSALSLEFEVYAKHNQAFQKKYIENKKIWHRQIVSAVEMLFSKQKVVPRMPPSQMALGLMALWSGMLIEASVSDADTADEILPLFLGSLLESSKRKR